MVDHIIGAIYFLNHFEIDHNGIRPDNVLVDDEGKYVLLDREIFAKKTNYQRSLDIYDEL